MQVLFLELAKYELDDAIEYYETQQVNLGIVFKNSIYKAIRRINEFPEMYIKINSDIRKSIIHNFPYSILYSIEDNHILIIAIAHQHREPDYWTSRTNT